MHVRCPHCRNPLEIVDESSLQDLECMTCGSHFSLLGDTETLEFQSRGKIGHFEFIETLGTGAFGTVWKARDTELDRIVAVKIPRKEQLSAQDAELFLREARTAAQLRHPNIVAVHEVGREDDTVFVVSDYIEGATLADWLTARTPTAVEAAQLCIKIADALQVAHEHGIVHRDLKPANIILDGDGEPHVTDFGLAKRDAAEITMTADGQILGTPAYMSPEQARGQGHAADRRSDVYSLGVVFFELLTGERPFRGNTRMLLFQVLNEEPPSPRKLNSSVPRDLETVALKCLEKDPRRRFSTTAEFGDELRRFLAGEPIRSRPISRAARLWRWSRRNPVVASLSAGIALLLVVGVTVVTALWLRAEDAARMASRHAASEAQMRKQAEDALASATAAELQANQNLQRARKAVRTFLTDVSTSPEMLKGAPGTQRLREQLLESAEAYYDELGDEYHSLSNLAFSKMRLGSVRFELGKTEEAAESYMGAIDVFEAILRSGGKRPSYRENLATAVNNLATLRCNSGQVADAAKLYQKALRLRQQQAGNGTLVVEYKAQLGRTYHGLGRVATALGDDRLADQQFELAGDQYRQAVKMGPDEPKYQHDLAKNHQQIGASLDSQARLNDALKHYQQAADILDRLIISGPNRASYLYSRGIIWGSIAEVLAKLESVGDSLPGIEHSGDSPTLAIGDPNSAINRANLAIDKAIEIFDSLVRDNPRVGAYRVVLANLYTERARFRRDDESLTNLPRAHDMLRELVAESPTNLYSQRAFADCCNVWGQRLRDSGKFDEARVLHERALEHSEKLVALAPDMPRHQWFLSDSHNHLAGALLDQGDVEEAERHYDDALSVATKLVDVHPQRARFRMALANSHFGRAQVFHRQKDDRQRGRELELADQTLNPLLNDSPSYAPAVALRREVAAFRREAPATQSDVEDAANAKESG